MLFPLFKTAFNITISHTPTFMTALSHQHYSLSLFPSKPSQKHTKFTATILFSSIKAKKRSRATPFLFNPPKPKLIPKEPQSSSEKRNKDSSSSSSSSSSMGCSASRPNTNIITKPQNSSHSFTSLESMASSHSSPPPVSRALSLPTPLVHHPPLKKGDTHHLVSLTSTTYGSLSLIDVQKPVIDDTQSFSDQDSPVHGGQTDSLSPDSVINTWELMDGLDDDDDVGHDFDLGKPKSKPSFNTIIKKSLTKPLWKHLSEESLLSKLDPNVVSSYRRALSSRASPSLSPSCSSLSDSWVKIPHTEKSQKTRNIVLYFTSLRGIRKTYEDCCCVRMIFRGFRVVVDEKDISMDSMYRTELQSLLGGKSICLPQVFMQGKHVGGVEEIKQLNENGELAKLLKGFPVRDPGIVCEGCGDARFVPCPNCSGSKKVFEEDEGRLTRCPDCNENGLIRCRACCSW